MNKFGLIGSNVTHSYSKLIHEIFYKEKQIEALYDLISVDLNQLESIVNKLKKREYIGLNVTIPYKTEILKYVDVFSDEVKNTNACNTLKVIDGKIHAFNTDISGFEFLLINSQLKINDSYILGSGGSSKTVEYVLKKNNINCKIVGRDLNFNYDSLNRNLTNQTIINTTPIGMFPNVENSVLEREVAEKANGIIDLIYNPKQTLLMSFNDNSFNGLSMLVYQAAKSFEIWTDKKIEINLINKIIKEFEV